MNKTIQERIMYEIEEELRDKVLDATDRDGDIIEEGFFRMKSFLNISLSKLRQEMIDEIIKKVENMSYVGVLDSNEKRRGYDIARQELLALIKEK